jgi:hypothetical protein
MNFRKTGNSGEEKMFLEMINILREMKIGYYLKRMHLEDKKYIEGWKYDKV